LNYASVHTKGDLLGARNLDSRGNYPSNELYRTKKIKPFQSDLEDLFEDDEERIL